MFALITPQIIWKTFEENPEQKRFWRCPSNGIFGNWWKMVLVLGPSSRDRKSLGTQQTQVKPNANRGWPIKLANHIQPHLSRLCGKSSGTPPHKMQMGTPILGISTLCCVSGTVHFVIYNLSNTKTLECIQIILTFPAVISLWWQLFVTKSSFVHRTLPGQGNWISDTEMP